MENRNARGATEIVWNGVDSYIETEEIRGSPDYDYCAETRTLYTRRESFKAFLAMPLPLPLPADVENDAPPWLVVTESGKAYKMLAD